MASIAIDPSDIRTSPVDSYDPGEIEGRPVLRGRRRGTRALAAVGLGIAVLAAAAAVAYQSIPALPRLAGFASSVEFPRPRRADIRIGNLPDMPDIRDGVPAIVAAKPVRVIETRAEGPPAAPPAPRPAPAPRAVEIAVPPAPPVPAPEQVLMAAREIVASVEPVATATLGQAALPARFSPPVPSGETALSPSPTDPGRGIVGPVPLPPPAPARLGRTADAAAGRPVADRTTARPARPASRVAATAPPTDRTAAKTPAPPGEDDDRVEVLGIKIPSARDVGNALASFGEKVINLPNAF